MKMLKKPLDRPLTYKDMLEAKAAFMSEREQQRASKKRTKRNTHKVHGGQDNSANRPTNNGDNSQMISE